MTVDIITTVRNGQAYIQEAVDSVGQQSFTNWKHYILNDGSTDSTATIINDAAAKDPRIETIHQPALGISPALNNAIKAGDGELIAIIDCDDLWEPGKLQKQVDTFRAEAELNFCFTNFKEFNDIQNIYKHTFRAREQVLTGCLKSAVMFRRSVLDTYGFFDENISTGDFLAWLSEPIRLNEKLKVIDEVLTYRRVHGNNMTATLNRKEYLTVLKQHLDKKRAL